MHANFVVFAGRTGDAPPHTHYLNAYATYRSVWEETFRSIRGET